MLVPKATIPRNNSDDGNIPSGSDDEYFNDDYDLAIDEYLKPIDEDIEQEEESEEGSDEEDNPQKRAKNGKKR